MKKIISILCFICLLFGCAKSNTDYTIELDETNGSWNYSVDTSNIVEIDHQEESNIGDGTVSGTNGKITYTIHGVNEGEVTITFTYDEGDLTAVYTLDVDSNNNVTEKEHSGSYFDDGMKLDENEEVTEKQMKKETGIDLASTKDMEDVHYSVLDMDGTKVSQMDFTLNEKKYCYRAAYTESTSLEEVQDLSGLGKNRVGISEEHTIQNCNATVYDRGDGTGYVIWIDTNSGIVYTLSMNEDVDTSLLLQTASSIFVPVQGE